MVKVRRGIALAVLIVSVLPLALIYGMLAFQAEPPFVWKNLTIVEKNMFMITLDSSPGIFIPQRILSSSAGVERSLYLYVGLGCITFEDQTENYVFLYLTATLRDFRIGLKSLVNRYLLAYISNSSLIDGVMGRYGLPHTYARAYFFQTVQGSANKTYLRFELPNGDSLAEFSAIITGSIEFRSGTLDECFYHLNGNNLTAIRLTGNYTDIRLQAFNVSSAHANVTFSEKTLMWNYIGTSLAIRRSLSAIYAERRFEGKIGWMDWR
ncbi:MAG: hypothetical protein RMJ07_04620 [Nitrososphaerota archaeon]|nr:hypothetical protein [Candidatus Bathyarchaeota archaeon]MDW8048948.1 hypothetical protein [Nitrososphaerota archaeon]